MKIKILISALFTGLFVAVSAGIIYLNSVYHNVFEFDFSPRLTDYPVVETSADTLHTDINLADPEIDSLHHVNDISTEENVVADPLKEDSPGITALLDSLKNLKKSIETPDIQTTTPDNFLNKPPNENSKDSSYQQWLKTTADLYAMMDAKKAAKIIQNFSDNIARDIIYTMRKKNAAKILAELNPEIANRITNFSQ